MAVNENTGSYEPTDAIRRNAYVNSMEQYQEMYKKSLEDPQAFWGDIAKQFHWETEADPNEFFSYNFDVTKGPIYTKWMSGASTNISFNLLDRHVKNGHADQVAYYW